MLFDTAINLSMTSANQEMVRMQTLISSIILNVHTHVCIHTVEQSGISQRAREDLRTGGEPKSRRRASRDQ